MPTAKPRIQVTIDDELHHALDAVDPAPKSRARLVRDLALRGAQAIRDEQEGSAEAVQVLLEIARGERDHDFDAVRELVAARGDRLP